MHNASQAACCDNPDIVTKYYPLVACRTCGMIWDQEESEPTFQANELIATNPAA